VIAVGRELPHLGHSPMPAQRSQEGGLRSFADTRADGKVARKRLSPRRDHNGKVS
jgi:hypothetical protein